MFCVCNFNSNFVLSVVLLDKTWHCATWMSSIIPRLLYLAYICSEYIFILVSNDATKLSHYFLASAYSRGVLIYLTFLCAPKSTPPPQLAMQTLCWRGSRYRGYAVTFRRGVSWKGWKVWKTKCAPSVLYPCQNTALHGSLWILILNGFTEWPIPNSHFQQS